MGFVNMLSSCFNCREDSVIVKVYIRKSDGKKCRVEYCLNGCGYFKALPFPKEVVNAKELL